jgi:ubiquinone/menaquinone biosynthesis C-methylase UbiE
MTQIEFDESIAEGLEELYSKRDVIRRRALVREALAARPGERILDLGCGPGFYVAELLDEVGEDGWVTGVDASPAMLAVAAKRVEGRENVELHEGDATSLPVEDASFDRALSVQVMEYVPDISAGLAEVHRALRPGGRVLIWDVDWASVSWHARDEARMRRVLEAWDKHLIHPSLPRTLAAQLTAAGFEDVRMDAHPFATSELSPETYGGSLVALLEGYVVAQGGMDEADAKAWAAEQRELGESGEFYFVVVQVCFTASKPG